MHACRSTLEDPTEFADPTPAGQTGIAAMLERGLVPEVAPFGVVVMATRWHGLPELETRSAAVGLGWSAARVAAGVSQTGDGDLAWSTLALAAGAGNQGWGVALRGDLRRRAAVPPGFDAIGGELGAGAWVAASSRARVWASAPQLWIRGDSPPLERWLEIGSRVDLGEAAVWLARAAAPGSPHGLRAEHLAGLSATLGLAAVWLEGRDHPARGTLGLAAFAGGVRVSASVEGHPVLAETVRLALSWGEPSWW